MMVPLSEHSSASTASISTSTSTSTSSATPSSSSGVSTNTEDEEEDSKNSRSLDGKIKEEGSTSTSLSPFAQQSHQHDPILRNEDGSMLTTPQNIPMVITKDHNKLIHLDPVPNFKDKADIKPWLQKIFYPMGIEIVIERSDNTKVVFKCKASKRGRKSRKSSVLGTPNNTTSTFEDTVKECAEKFIIHDDAIKKKSTISPYNTDCDDNKGKSKHNKNEDGIPPVRVKKKRAVSRFNVCPFRIRATYSLKRHKWSIVVINNIHSHDLNFDPNSEEYKKFKAKLREDNDLEAIKKFDELEYRKRSNLPIQTAMIPCDCGMTNEIESFNIVIPNTNPKSVKKITTKQAKTKTVVSSPSSSISTKLGTRRTINDLIMKKKPEQNIIPSEKDEDDLKYNNNNNNKSNKNNNHTNVINNEQQILLDDIINNPSKNILKVSSFLNNPEWNINPLSESDISNNLMYIMMNGNNHNNNRDGTTLNEHNNSLLYGINNNDSHTDIIHAKDKIIDEENDEEVENIIHRDSDYYEYNGSNQISNEYYHNRLDSYNTDHFYKFNGPFDSGNVIINNLNNYGGGTPMPDNINTNSNYNTTAVGNNNNDGGYLFVNNMMNTVTNNNNNIPNYDMDSHRELLTNNFIDDPVLHNSPLMTTLNFNNTDNLIGNVGNHTTSNTNNNNMMDNWNSHTNNPTTTTNEYNLMTSRNNNNNIIDLNEIDFTDIFSSGAVGTNPLISTQFNNTNTETALGSISKPPEIKQESKQMKPENGDSGSSPRTQNVPPQQPQVAIGATLSKELNQFIDHLEETSKSQIQEEEERES